MKKASEVFSSIRFAKLDPKHEKAGPISTDDEEHGAVSEKEYEQQVKHVKKRAMQEQSDTMEKVEMVKSQLHFIKYACEEILEYIDMGGEVEEWYQVKVAKSFSEFESLHAFMEGESRRKGMKEEVEQIDEMDKSQPSSSRGAEGLPLGKKAEPAKTDKVKSDALKILQKQFKKEEVVVEGDDLGHLDAEVFGRIDKEKKRKADLKKNNPAAYAREKEKDSKNYGRGIMGVLRRKYDQPLKVKEEVEELDEISSALVKRARDAAYAKGKEDQMHRFVRKHYEKEKKESDAFGKKMAEEVEQLDEKNVPTNPSLWSRAKALARSKFDVYPSAYANGWASKWYKGKGGGWKSVSESVENPPFEGGTKPKDKAVPGKYGKGYSTARHLARMAMKKQSEKMKKAPMKEETRKAAIVKDIMKKKTEPDDKFQANPTLTSQVQKVDNAVT